MQSNLTIILETISQKILTHLPNILLAFFILIIGFKLEKKIEQLILKQYQKQNIDDTIIRFTHSLINTVYKVIIVLLAISTAGIQTTSIVAILGAFSFAIALALKNSISDFASGLLIIANKTIKVGEYIELKSYQGTVTNIEVCHTTLLTSNNKSIIIPNSLITNNILVNHSRTGNKKIKLKNDSKN